MATAKLQLVHLSTVHSRTDTRIFVKQVMTLFSAMPMGVSLVVADGLGYSAPAGEPPVYDLGELPVSRFRRALAGNFRAFRFFRRTQPDLIHFHDPELIPLGIVLSLLGVKVIYDVHEDVPRQTMSKHWIPLIFRSPVAKVTAAIEWLAGLLFSGIVPATHTIAARFPAGKTVLVQNYPIPLELAVTQPTAYVERSPKFVYVGAVADIRGGREMVQAMEHLTDLPDVRLEIAGNISPESFAGELQCLHGWQQVIYHGLIGRQEVALLLGSARAGLVLLHPTINYVDAQPVKLFEYMAAGIPVIASDFPLLREIVTGAGCGLLVNPLDPIAIAIAFRWILEHPLEAEIMGKKGREAVYRTYNWESEATQLIGLYNKLLPAKPS